MPLQLSASLNLTGSINLSGSMSSTQTLNLTSSYSVNSATSSWSINSLTASYALTSPDGGGGTTLTTGSTYPITSSWSNNSISSSYAATASVLPNFWVSSSINHTPANSSVAAFDNSGAAIVVTPTETNSYLVFQNGVLKWIPIASVAVSFLNSVFSQEINIEDGQYNISIVPVAQYISSFTSGSI